MFHFPTDTACTKGYSPNDTFISIFSTEIPEFLSDEECDHIISLAIESGLTASTIGRDNFNPEGLDEAMNTAGALTSRVLFKKRRTFMSAYIRKHYIYISLQHPPGKICCYDRKLY